MKLKYLWFIILALCLILAGCSKDTEIESIRIGFFPNITHAQALYGKNTGQYQDAFGDKLRVDWIEFNAGPAEIEAMFAGEVDIGYIGPIPAINAYIKSNGDVKVIAGATNGGAILVTRSDLHLNSTSELSGLKIAVPQFGNTQHISLLNILQESGFQTSDKGGTAQVVQAANSDIKLLLDQKNIDAALVPEPWGARLVNEIDANIFLDEKQIWKNGDYPVALVIARKDFIEKHPDLVETFLRTHESITNQITDDMTAAEDIINNELLVLTKNALKPKVLEEAFGRIGITSEVNIEILADFAGLLEEQGFSTEKSDISDIIYVKGS